MAKKTSTPTPTAFFTGVPAAPGIAVGPARKLEDPLQSVEERHIPVSGVEAEVVRFQEALDRARIELAELREATKLELDEETARIFDVQLMVLQDPLAVDRTIEAIREERKNAGFLFRRHMLEASERIEELPDSFFSDRAADLIDVKRRVLRHLAGDPANPSKLLKRGVILSREIAPSEAVMLDPAKVLGLATEAGGSTSHAAIMARARGIPAVVGVRGLSEVAQDGDVLAVDGFRGSVEINPPPHRLEAYRERKRLFTRLQKRHAKLALEPSCTTDGRRVLISANLELPAEMETMAIRGAEGVGLFRTEFFFMSSRTAPNEDRQTRVYREVIEKAGAGGVDIRVLDVGGDKVASYMGMVRERNPFLGLRGIRYLIAHPGLFETQIRAILRASLGGKARILFPMMSSVHEFHTARRLIKKAMTSLKRRKVPFDKDPKLGVMIEVPSAMMMAEEFAREADFLSVGSNDLIQYLLAIDRDNQSLLHLYQPHHPAVLRGLKLIVDAGHKHGKQVSICGEMAGDPLSVPLLVGLGFDRLSVSPYSIPDIKQTVRVLDHANCVELVSEALVCEDPEEVAAKVRERTGSQFSDLLHLINASNGKPRGGSVSRGRDRRGQDDD